MSFVVAQACNPSNWEVEAGGLRVRGQDGLRSKTASKTKSTITNHPIGGVVKSKNLG